MLTYAKSPLLIALLGIVSLEAAAFDTQDPTPGSDKFPGEIFAPTRFQVGYSGGLFRQNFTYGIGSRGLERTKCERGAESDPWSCRTATEGTSYYITGLDTREGGDEVFIAGLADDGTCLIERWAYETREHGRGVTVPVPDELVLGTPLAATTTVQTIEGGGSWQPIPATLQTLPSATRRVVYTTTRGPLHGVAVDPEGRYLVVYDMGLQQLLQLDLTQMPPATSVLGEPSTHSSLDQVGAIDLRDFGEEGRKCLVRREYQADFRASREVYTLFSDADNDGVFESSTIMTQTEWEASPYSDWSQWHHFWRE